MKNKIDETKKELKEQTDFLSQLKHSFEDLKHGRVHKHIFKY
ncbi:MAG: hypothetical protein ACLFPQ_05445 [Candidatus Woesearchaeota archaeon]